jgi:uncharacterized protein YllA (UPF0747 family)
MNLAIVFALDPEMGQTFSLSREVDENATKQEIYNHLKAEAELSDDAVDTILVVKSVLASGDKDFIGAPEVVHFWTAASDNFSDC